MLLNIHCCRSRLKPGPARLRLAAKAQKPKIRPVPARPGARPSEWRLWSDTVCLELIRHKDGSIVSITKISEVIVFNCSSLILWNLQLYNNSLFLMKNVTFLGGEVKNTLTSYIFSGVRTPTSGSTPLSFTLVAGLLCACGMVWYSRV